jgi:hypothetical protein
MMLLIASAGLVKIKTPRFRRAILTGIVAWRMACQGWDVVFFSGIFLADADLNNLEMIGSGAPGTISERLYEREVRNSVETESGWLDAFHARRYVSLLRSHDQSTRCPRLLLREQSTKSLTRIKSFSLLFPCRNCSKACDVKSAASILVID